MRNSRIDWCDSTWNPISGCLHGCPYCYARRMVTRFGKVLPDRSGAGLELYGDERLHILDEEIKGNPYPYGFEPTFHSSRLDVPQKWKKPQTVFVCSMADLFGRWVPDEWIRAVFAAADLAPQHKYLFLTKNPIRYSHLPDDCFRRKKAEFWFGTTVTSEEDISRIVDLSASWRRNVPWFCSVEPLCGDVGEDGAEHLAAMDWVILGAENGYREGKVYPKREWVDRIVERCDRSGTPVFMKESLRHLMGDDMRQAFPWGIIR